IYALNNSNTADKRRIINIIKNHNNESDEVKKVIDFVIAKGGLEYATKIMHQYKDRALEILKEIPNSPAKESLEALIKYSIERKK
ncbi:MAG: hypothetical protein ACK5ZT_11545, partial [Sphingobacteriaceae bacterium]